MMWGVLRAVSQGRNRLDESKMNEKEDKGWVKKRGLFYE